MREFQVAFAVAMLLVAPLCPADAKVSPVTYFFYARVTAAQGDGVPQPGDIVPITIKLDQSYPVNTHTPHSHTNVYSGGVGYDLPTPILSVRVNHQNGHGIFDVVTVSKNDNGHSGVTIQSFSTGDVGFTASFSTTVSGVVRSLGIPNRIYPGNFQSATFSVSLSPAQSFSGEIVE